MKVIKLDIDEENEFEGIDAVALVAEPAIEMDFQFFSKQQFAETYNDYPKAARTAAEQGIKRNKAINNKCGTAVGKRRATQLANGENISIETVKRMRSFLLRQKDNYDLAVRRSDYNACGYISYLLWGGPAALPWATKKLRQAGKLEESNREVIMREMEVQRFKSVVVDDDFAIIDDRLAYSTQEKAEEMAKNIGCKGFHTHDFEGKTWYMPCEKHMMAEVGPRGGIRPSKKAPKSDTKNPNPKGKGTAKGSAKTSRGAKVSKSVEKTLQKKADDFNERYKKKRGYGVTVGQLKAVYQRGLGAYNTSRSPKVAARGGAKQWAMARVNAYLYLVKNGRPQNKKYTADYDLLPSKHPKSNKKMYVNRIKTQRRRPGAYKHKKKKKYYTMADQRDIDGIPVFANPEDALQLADSIGCEGVHKHQIDGEIVYMPCKSHTEATDKMLGKIEANNSLQFHGENYFSDFTEEEQEQLIKNLKSVGKTKEEMIADGWVEMSEEEFNNALYAEFAVKRSDSNPDKGSLLDTSEFQIRFRYKGTIIPTSRTFCRQMVGLKLEYRLEDINNMSLFGANEEFSTYDIFTYKGSYNCRHSWEQVRYKREDRNYKKADSISTLENLIGGPRAQQAAQVNPKARTQAELAGPLMIPDQLIPRFDEQGDKYYVFFDKEGIKKLSYKLMKNKLIDSVNIEHDKDRRVADLTLVESWLVADTFKDKSNKYGYNLPVGSWFGVYKVNNQAVWDNYVKTGKVKGFSVEGIFADKTILAKKQEYAFTKS